MFAHIYKFSLIAAVVLVFYKRQSKFLYQATLSINRRETRTCTLFFKEDLLQKILQPSE